MKLSNNTIIKQEYNELSALKLKMEPHKQHWLGNAG